MQLHSGQSGTAGREPWTQGPLIPLLDLLTEPDPGYSDHICCQPHWGSEDRKTVSQYPKHSRKRRGHSEPHSVAC